MSSGELVHSTQPQEITQPENSSVELMERKANELPPEAQEKALSIAKKLNLADSNSIITYGNDVQQQMSSFADQLLQQVKSGDTGEIGGKLTSIITQAKSLNLGGLGKGGKNMLANLPLVGGLFNEVEKFKQQFSSISQQIEQISTDLKKAQQTLLTRNQTLDEIYKLNLQQFVELNILIAAGKEKINEVTTQVIPRMETEISQSNDALKAQEMFDLKQGLQRFEKRIHDLELTRMTVLQTAPQIRMIQANNQALAEKIQSTIYLTVPLWKEQFVMATALIEQQEVAKLESMVTDANNDLLNSNAKMLQQNTVNIAKANERGVIDIETLQNVQKTLFDTCEEVLKIQQEGKAKRIEAEKALGTLETELRQKLSKSN